MKSYKVLEFANAAAWECRPAQRFVSLSAFYSIEIAQP